MQCYLGWLREGGYSRILRDCQSYVILLLVPIILPLNLLTGLQRIVGGFRIALGLLGLQSELNCTIHSSSHPFAQFLFRWITWGRMGLHGLFNCDEIDCYDYTIVAMHRASHIPPSGSLNLESCCNGRTEGPRLPPGSIYSAGPFVLPLRSDFKIVLGLQ